MADSIGIGTLSTSNGSPRLVGSQSELDTDALVEASYQAKRIPAVRLETKISNNEVRIAAYQEMQGLLGDLKSALGGLRNPPGILGRDDNVFETKQAFFTTNGATNPQEVLGLTVANRAAPGNYEVEVKQLAAANKLTLNGVASRSQTLADAWNGGGNFTGDLTIDLGGGDSATISVDGAMTISGLEAAINAEASTTGVRAGIIQVSDSEFRLTLTGQETGKAINLTYSDTTGGLAGLGETELQEESLAVIELDGVEITRSANRFDDLIPGVSFDLFQARPSDSVNGIDNSIKISIESNLSGAKEQITAFVDSYNAFRDFVDRNSTISANGEVSDEAVLFGDRTMRSTNTGLTSILGGAASGLDADTASTLRDVGIKLGSGSRLEIDEAVLDNALLTDLDGVRGVFEFGFEADSPNLGVFGRTNALSDTEFELVITDADNDGVPEAVTADGVAFDVTGSTIKGAAGTAYEGLDLIWAGSGSETINVKTSQGIADKAFNYLETTLDQFDGPMARAVQGLESANVDYAARMQRIEERAEQERERLIEAYGKMESALALANSMIDQIKAQMKAFEG